MRYLVDSCVLAVFGIRRSSPVPRKASRRLIGKSADALRDVHDRGADLYNTGDMAGGYRMYQGGLIVARGMLGHRPDLQKTIADWHGRRRPPAGHRPPRVLCFTN